MDLDSVGLGIFGADTCKMVRSSAFSAILTNGRAIRAALTFRTLDIAARFAYVLHVLSCFLRLFVSRQLVNLDIGGGTLVDGAFKVFRGLGK